MAKLPDKWDEPRQRETPPPPEVQVIQAMRNSGFGFDETLKLEWDGRFHHVHLVDEKRNKKSGWYVLFGDGIPAGAFGSWKLQETKKWRAAIDRPLSKEEEFLLQQKYEKIRIMREAEERKRHEAAAKAVKNIWENSTEAPNDHAYFVKKNVKNYGLRVTGDGRLILPIYTQPDKLTSLQYIDADGSKRFQSGGEVAGGVFFIKKTSECLDNSIYIVEGYATGASVHEATGAHVCIALNAGNLSKVAEKIAPVSAGARIVIVADNDASGVGQKAAQEAAALIGATCVIPPKNSEGESMDANDYVASGGDLKALLAPKEERPWLLSAADFCKNRDTAKWFIKGHVLQRGMQMVFGDSGTGKTFYVLDLLLTIASNVIQDWFGVKVKHGNVVYLAGEGHVGLRARIAGWAYKHNVSLDSVHLYVSQNAVDINAVSVADYVINEIEKMNVIPDVIAIDTLHCFLEGDENTAKDAKSFLSACRKISDYFNKCTVILIHHTGVNADAKGRARGSSAWKGAMDLEVMVSKNPGDSLILITQTKSKDTELAPKMWLNQVDVTIPDWFDDDGDPVKTVVLELGSPSNSSKEETLSDKVNHALDDFIKASFACGTLDESGKYCGLAEEDWRDYFYKHSSAASVNGKRTAYNRTRNILLENALLYVDDDNVYHSDGFLCETFDKIITKHLKEKNKRGKDTSLS